MIIKRPLCLSLVALGLCACKPGMDTHWLKFEHATVELELPSRAMVSSNAIGDTSTLNSPSSYSIIIGDSMSPSHQTLTLSLPTPDHPNGPITMRLAQGAELRYRQGTSQLVGTLSLRGRKLAVRCEGGFAKSPKWCEELLSTVVLSAP